MINPKNIFSKNKKRNLSKSDSDTEDYEFPRYVFIESMEETALNKLLIFLIEKVICKADSKSVKKKVRNGNLKKMEKKQKQITSWQLKWKFP